jgi:tyrosine-protein kinase Etk/Wzc
VLALRAPADLAVESLRSLRTALLYSLIEARSNVVAMAGPSPAIGTSFVAFNLAQLLADSGQRTLLVDGDLRDGHLHSVAGFERGPGLSELLAGGDLAPAVRRVSDGLDLLTAGRVPPNPSELLMGPRFRDLIDRASREYQLVVIDTPPILAVTDAAIIARQAGVTLVVLRPGQHPMRDATLAVRRLSQSGVRPAGIVLNDVRRGASAAAYGSGLHGHDRPGPTTVATP